MTQKIALNVNLTTPKQMSNNVFILLQIYVLHLIDGLAYINRFQKKTSDIDSRIVWPSLDVCKGMNNSHSYKLSEGFLPLRKQIRPRWQREARVSERKRRKPARLFTADSSAPMRIRMGAVLAADVKGGHICGLQGRKPESLGTKTGGRILRRPWID